MAEGFITRRGNRVLTPVVVSAETGTTTAYTGLVLTANTGLVGKKKRAFVSSFLVGANTNNPTLTVILYGSTDGTNFTQIGTYTLPKNNTTSTKAVSGIQSFATGDYTYFRATGSGVLTGQAFGFGITLGVI